MTRYSTTAKLTRKLLSLVRHWTRKGDGVIVRLHGQELGIIAVVPGSWLAIDVDGNEVDLRHCTIRKGLPVVQSVAIAA